MFRRPIFWIFFILLAICSCIFIYFYGARAFSFIDVKTTMDRTGSLNAADSLHIKMDIPIKNYKKTTIFKNDWDFQNYVEMKAGGKKAFTRILKSNIYSSYTWEIRHFREGDVHEVSFFFTPTGKPYGFTEKLSETDQGVNVSNAIAVAIADSIVTNDWQIDLKPYKLVESSQEVVQSGRIDHTIEYERKDAQVGDALYRLKLVVSGNRLTTLDRYYKVPDKFWKEYEQMRSSNETIASIGSAFMFVFYILGAIIWIFLFLKKKQLIWKPAFLWAGIIAGMGMLNALNSFPYIWLGYDTSLSSNSFIAQQIVYMLVQTIVDSMLLFVTFLAAEALTRKAFPQHVQLWKTWSKDTATTTNILGKTLGGYLVIPLYIAYAVAFYLFTIEKLGWWQPSSTISDPNILASYVPWFSSIANALHAGFWEESLFRAVPLATMAIIGSKFGKRNLFIGIGLILQAVIFGSMHANYAAQPAYARLVELIIPSLMFGLVYLRFGLLTGIIVHFAFDAVLMDMSAFFTRVPGIWIDRIVFILVLFIPIWIIFFRRLQTGKWTLLPETSLNRNWFIANTKIAESSTGTPIDSEENIKSEDIIAEPVSEPAPLEPGTIHQRTDQRKTTGLVLITIAIMICLGLISYRIKTDTIHTQLTITSKQAVVLATQALKEDMKITLPSAFKAYPETQYVNPWTKMSKFFVLKQGSMDNYRSLLTRGYVNEDGWTVKFQRFQGTLAERTEKYYVRLEPNGKMISCNHVIAEDAPGGQLTEDQARTLALQTIIGKFNIDAKLLEEIKVDPKQLPNRIDWTFVYRDKSPYPLREGQTRINVYLTGDKVNTSNKYIYVPEKWSRNFNNDNTMHDSVKMLFTILAILVLFGAFTIGIIRWSKKQFDLKRASIVFLVVFFCAVLAKVLGVQHLIGNFSTIEPYNNQIITAILSGLVSSLFIAGAVALINGVMGYWHRNRILIQTRKSMIYSLLVPLVLIVAYIQSPLGRYFDLVFQLGSPSYKASVMSLPGLYIATAWITIFYLFYGVLQFLFFVVYQFTSKGKKLLILEPILFLIFGISAAFLSIQFIQAPFLQYTILTGITFALILYVLYKIFIFLEEKYWKLMSMLFISLVMIGLMFQNAFHLAYIHYFIGLVIAVCVLLLDNLIERKRV